ncbi:MAG: DUF5946 family protein [Candidatus Limnocylindria bacterium]
MQTAAVILAAGASTRFGSPKQLARIGGRTMLEIVAQVATDAGLEPVIVVIPPGLAVPSSVVPAINDDPAAGLSRSLRLGLAAVPAEANAAMVLLGDQPTASRDTLTAILEASRGDRPVVAARAHGGIGPPVLLLREAFELATEASGDEGLRAILAQHPELVMEVDVKEHVPDVDTLEDLAALIEPCPGCGATFLPRPDGAIHDYIGASPACWAAFGELLAREFQDPAYGWIHRHTVDVYTVQHPGINDRRQRQSVALHLIGLDQWLELGMDTRMLNPITQRLASERRDWPWLEPPMTYELTVLDVLAATSADEHGHLVREWAESVWQAWSPHHLLIRQWADEALH